MLRLQVRIKVDSSHTQPELSTGKDTRLLVCRFNSPIIMIISDAISNPRGEAYVSVKPEMQIERLNNDDDWRDGIIVIIDLSI
jgi:hypothetical protein